NRSHTTAQKSPVRSDQAPPAQPHTRTAAAPPPPMPPSRETSPTASPTTPARHTARDRPPAVHGFPNGGPPPTHGSTGPCNGDTAPARAALPRYPSWEFR